MTTPEERAHIRAALTEEQAVTCTLYGEAAGESIEGIVAVGCVIRNRALNPRWWGRGYKGVCLLAAQFSCWWEKAPNTDRLYDFAELLLLGGSVGEPSIGSELRWVAAGIVGDQLRDSTRTADHYLTTRLFHSPQCPAWAKGRVPAATIGGHTFLRIEL